MSGLMRCNHPSTSDTNCRSDNSLSIVSSQCDGKNSCSVEASNSVFGDPCLGTYKYLQARYYCRAAVISTSANKQRVFTTQELVEKPDDGNHHHHLTTSGGASSNQFGTTALLLGVSCVAMVVALVAATMLFSRSVDEQAPNNNNGDIGEVL
eukprot:TRINITY_DN63003_c0_g1_i1.p1 TRINITY_DN63003_c0_g1~~TRINITY_DN63003_c0_g1_i1.p1  ORF type:complete len:159 (-),score=36.46 TRINITY_DN63003_c0_g1_i1:135-590(-)